MKIIAAGNTMVPAILALEQLGFGLSIRKTAAGQTFVATRAEETYSADDPVTLLGLVKLIEMRSWEWRPTDTQVDATLKKYSLG
jgi:chitodextrinase